MGLECIEDVVVRHQRLTSEEGQGDNEARSAVAALNRPGRRQGGDHGPTIVVRGERPRRFDGGPGGIARQHQARIARPSVDQDHAGATVSFFATSFHREVAAVTQGMKQCGDAPLHG